MSKPETRHGARSKRQEEEGKLRCKRHEAGDRKREAKLRRIIQDKGGCQRETGGEEQEAGRTREEAGAGGRGHETGREGRRGGGRNRRQEAGDRRQETKSPGRGHGAHTKDHCAWNGSTEKEQT